MAYLVRSALIYWLLSLVGLEGVFAPWAGVLIAMALGVVFS